MKRVLRFSLPPMLLLAAAAHAGDGLESHIPASGVPEFLFHNLDIASFRSSLGPGRTTSDRTFASVSPPPTTVAADYVEVLEDHWVRRLTIVDRGDFNEDGIEDLAVRLDDRAIGATYRATKLLLVTRYTDSSLAVALDYEVSTPGSRDRCGATPEG